ncbi:MAG: ABC transporter permease, partial [Rhizobium sp.]
MNTNLAAKSAVALPPKRQRRLPQDLSILCVLVGIALIFEVLGWTVAHQSFLMNPQRLTIMILQVSVIGIISVGVTQVIITGGIDLSSGSVVGMTAMIAAGYAQSSTWARVLYPSLTDLPAIVPIGVGLLIGLLAGLVNGALIAYTRIPPFIATLGMMVSARGVAKWYTKGQPVSGLTDQFNFIGSGMVPVFVFLAIAVIFHIVLRYTRYGKFTYAIGANQQAARVS